MNSTLQNRNVHRTVLPNGIVVIVVENPAADIISGRLFLQAGGRWVPRSQAGLPHLLAATITKGTEELSSLEIAERVESIGAGIGADAANDYFLTTMKTVSSDFPEILELVASLLRSPTFPESEVELEKKLALSAIRSQQEQPMAVAFDNLRQAMYPDHPYAFSSLGLEETVAHLTREDIKAYHQQYFRPDNLVISLAGRITPDDAVALVEKFFGDWQAPQTPLPKPAFSQPIAQPSVQTLAQDTQQTILMLGYLTSAVRNLEDGDTPSPDYPVLKLLNTYLGNGLSSRLFVELRERQGLAYDISAFYPTRLDPSHFVAYMGTAPENTDTALQQMRSEIERLGDRTLSEETLQTAKNKLLGQYALGKQTNGQLAQIYGWYEILGLGVDFDAYFPEAIANVTPKQAQDVAQKYLQQPYISLVGPQNAIANHACS
ncbi:pitrilysin family protein [Geitlerinema sp. PCC 9228]|jgi:predicted Zn-dependent peptidase|uniref:M16 family metallopeptidase n=1 Tax=Geitlerinema sp. PCC 9228 TaxID=111611 RepID=UPI0008F9D6CE|nr:pitrilysin family protein [Geitlerinema sp. PCC 9228]